MHSTELDKIVNLYLKSLEPTFNSIIERMIVSHKTKEEFKGTPSKELVNELKNNGYYVRKTCSDDTGLSYFVVSTKPFNFFERFSQL